MVCLSTVPAEGSSLGAPSEQDGSEPGRMPAEELLEYKERVTCLLSARPSIHGPKGVRTVYRYRRRENAWNDMDGGGDAAPPCAGAQMGALGTRSR